MYSVVCIVYFVILIIKLTCSIEEPLCGNAIKSLLLFLLFLFLYNLVRNEIKRETVACGSDESRKIEKEVGRLILLTNGII